MVLIINEWIFHDLLGENGPEAFEATRGFVKRLFHSTDWIVAPNLDFAQNLEKGEEQGKLA